MKKLNEIINNHKAVFLGISVLLIVVITGVSFAIFRGKLKVVNQSETIVKSVRLGLIYTGIEEIKSDSMVSGDSFIKKFKVENKSEKLVYYNVFIEDTNNTFIKNELIYNLKSDKGIDIDGVMPVTKDGKTYLRVAIPIKGGETQNFELTVTYKYLEDVDQSYNDNATFKGTLGIDTLPYKVTNTYEKKAILANLTDETKVETTKMTISNETDEEIYYNLMLKDACEDPQNYKDVYYEIIKDGKKIVAEKKLTNKNFNLLENEVLESGESTEIIINYDKSTKGPELINSSSTYNSIKLEYTSGGAQSGIKETKCYLTDDKGNVLSEGTLNKDDCDFNLTPTKDPTEFYFKKCIVSNEGNTFCSDVSKKENIGYCSSTTASVGSWSSCSKSCGGGTQTRSVTYVSAYDSSLTCSEPSDGVTYTTSQSCNTRGCCDSVYASKSGSERIIGHDIYKNDGSNPSNVVQYRTYCQVYQNKSNYNGQNCGSAYLKYCSSASSGGSCGTYSSTDCSWRKYVSYFGGNSYNYSSYYTSWKDSAKWHVDTFGGTSVYDYGDGAYYNDSSRNVHDWYNIS